MSDEREMLAEVLNVQVWDETFGHRTAHAAHHFHAFCAVCQGDTSSMADALLASPQFARLIAAAKAEALREAADKWQWGEWTVLTPKVKRGGTAAVIGGAQVVTDWLRERAALTAEPAPTEGEGA